MAEKKKPQDLAKIEESLKAALTGQKASLKDSQYSEIMTEKDIKDLIALADAKSRFGKSRSYIDPYVRQVRNKKMSLKSALDKIPWWMQNDLILRLKKDKKRKS